MTKVLNIIINKTKILYYVILRDGATGRKGCFSLKLRLIRKLHFLNIYFFI